MLDSNFRVMIANRAFYDTFRLRRQDTKNALLRELGNGQWNVPALQEALRRALPENRSFEGVEISGKFQRIGQRIVSVAGRCVDLGESRQKILLVTMTDITASRQAEEQMRKAHSTLEKSLQTAESSLRESEADLRKNRGELRALAARLLATQEEERRRVSRELHDDLNQKLAMLEVDAERLGQQLNSSPAVVQKVRSLQSRVAEVSNDVRRVAYQLHPSILDHLGLAVALRSYCSEFSKREGIRVLLSTDGAPVKLPEPVALCLYRLTQESLRNVAKHASAKSASVKLRKSDKGIHLSIRDNGVGFNTAAPHKGGIGLLSMKERVRLVDGEFALQSKPGKGTQNRGMGSVAGRRLAIMKKTRLLIADDHTLVLEGLKRILESEVELVGTAENGRDLVRMNEQLKPDVVLVDISMPQLNGIDATRQLLKTTPNTKVIFVTMHADADYVAEAFRSGAAGYLLKRSAASELVAAIQEVMKGRYYVTPLVTREALSPLVWRRGRAE